MSQKIIFILCLIACSGLSQNSEPKPKPNRLFLSTGYGYPSTASFLAKISLYQNYADVNDKGVSFFRVDYLFTKTKLSIGAEISNVQFSFLYKNSFGAQGAPYSIGTRYYENDVCIGSRLNYYFLYDEYLTAYVGVGGGANIASISVPSFPLYIEAVLGVRASLNKYFGLYAEAGMGKALAQIGISIRL